MRKIYRELAEIRKELQAIRSSLELEEGKPYVETLEAKKILHDIKDKCDYVCGFVQGMTNRTRNGLKP